LKTAQASKITPKYKILYVLQKVSEFSTAIHSYPQACGKLKKCRPGAKISFQNTRNAVQDGVSRVIGNFTGPTKNEPFLSRGLKLSTELRHLSTRRG
jgi:hypothetical protein